MDTFLHREKPGAVIRVSDEDSLDYLQSQLSVNLSVLEKGGCRFALRLNTRGRVLAGIYVLRTAEEEFLLVSRTSKASFLLELLAENVVADEVEFADETKQWNIHAVWGGSTEKVLEDHDLSVPESGKFVSGQSGYAWLDSRLPDETVSLLIRENLDPENQPLPPDLQLVEADELERLRIEAGLVSVPQEIGPNDLPQEGGLAESSVDFDKGCYLGQEVMARLRATGKARRQTVPVKWSGQDLISTPVGLYSGNRKLGELRSLVMGKDGGHGIALVNDSAITGLKSEGLIPKGSTAGKVTSS